MTIAEALARPLIAGVFIYGGIDTLRNPGSKVDVADPILEPASKATGLGPEQLVAINAGVQVVAGVALAVGILPRPAAASWPPRSCRRRSPATASGSRRIRRRSAPTSSTC